MPLASLTSGPVVRTVATMLRRLLLGVVIGVVVGGLAAYAVGQAFPWMITGVLAYPLSAVIGVVVGLVAGRPIWAKGAAIEAGLKAVVGALLGAGLLFGLRYVPFSLPALGTWPPASLGQHPMALTAVSLILSMFYELDDSGEAPQAEHTRVAVDKSRVAQLGEDAETDAEAEDASGQRDKKRR